MLRMELQDLTFVLLCFGLVSLKSFHVISFSCWNEDAYSVQYCISEVHNFIFDITEAQETKFRLCVCVCVCVCVYQALYLIFLKQGFLLNLELAVSGRLEGQGTLACLCPFHQH